MANANARRNIEAFQVRIEAELAQIGETILKRTTLRPDDSVAGVVYVDDAAVLVMPQTTDLVALIVWVGRDRHSFRFMRRY